MYATFYCADYDRSSSPWTKSLHITIKKASLVHTTNVVFDLLIFLQSQRIFISVDPFTTVGLTKNWPFLKHKISGIACAAIPYTTPK